MFIKYCLLLIILHTMSLNILSARENSFIHYCKNNKILNREDIESIEVLKAYFKTQQCEIIDNRLMEIKSLSLSGLGIKSIKFLKFYTHYEKIDLSDNQINSIEALSHMKNILQLRLSENEIEDITPLSKIDSIELLSMADNYIKILPPLNCKNLLALDLSRNNISNIDNLQSCKKLNFLFLQYNQIKDVTPLAYLSGYEKIKNWSELDEYKKNELIDWNQLTKENLGLYQSFKVVALENNPLGRPVWHGGVIKNKTTCPEDSSFEVIRKFCYN